MQEFERLKRYISEVEASAGYNSEEYAAALDQLASFIRLHPHELFHDIGGRNLDAGEIEIQAKMIRESLPLSDESQSKEDEIDCPFCAEKIKARAVLCKHCHSILPSPAVKAPKRLEGNTEEREQAKPSNRIEDEKSQEEWKARANLEHAIDSGNFVVAVTLLSPEQATAYQAEVSRVTRSVGIAYLLLFLTFLVGGHKFYIRETGWGFIYLAGGLGSSLLFLSVVGIPLAIFCGVVMLVGVVFDLYLIPIQVSRSNDRARISILRELASYKTIGDKTIVDKATADKTIADKTIADKAIGAPWKVETGSYAEKRSFFLIVIFCSVVILLCVAIYLYTNNSVAPEASEVEPKISSSQSTSDSSRKSWTNETNDENRESTKRTSPNDWNNAGKETEEEDDAEDNLVSETSEIIESILRCQQDSDLEGVESGFDKLLSFPNEGTPSSSIAVSLNQSGLDELRRGNSSKAVEFFEAAVRNNPDNSKYQNNLGLAQINAGDIESAKNSLKTAIRLEPYKTIAWGNLAVAFCKEGEREKAVAAFLVAAKTSREEAIKFISRIDDPDDRVQSVKSYMLTIL